MQMRVFLYEYTCAAGGAVPSPAAALRSEGAAMLSALLEDFGRVEGVETLTLLEERCKHEPRVEICRRVRAQDEEIGFRELAAPADWTLVVAPEFDAILSTRCRWVVESGGRLLGPSLAAVELSGDKWALAGHLRARGVPAPESHLPVPGKELPTAFFPAVWKPRYGAGSQATFLVRNSHELRNCSRLARLEGWRGEAVLQPFTPGRPASIAFLTGPRCRIPLLPAAQRLSEDGRFHYLGGSVPLPGPLSKRALAVAERALETIPELAGYVGVDVVLGEAEDGSGDAVIEVNPRLTTSYVGLRVLATTNLAEAWLKLALGTETPNVSWRPGTVHFDADGAVRCDS